MPLTPNISYVQRTFQAIYRLPEFPPFDYGESAGAAVFIHKSNTRIFEEGRPVSEADITWHDWKGTRIPVLFADGNPELLEFREGKVLLHFDVIAAAFYFLSGWQEFVCQKKDRFGRFPFEKSLQKQLGITHFPVVNYYFEILKEALEASGVDFPTGSHWQEKDFAVFLSHDIDKCRSGWKQGGKSELKKGRIFSFVRLVAKRFLGRDDWFNLAQIVELEQAYGATSTFFMLCRQGMIADIPHADYDASAAYMNSEYEGVEAVGSEVAVHGSHGTHLSAAALKDDIQLLNRPVTGNRYHYLCYSTEFTPALLQEVGMQYDATLGFAEHFGFRNGLCHPFFLYDLTHDQPTEVLEIPLMLMDTTLMNPQYMGVGMEEVPELVDGLLSEVKKFAGVLCVLWHNNYFSQYKYAGWKELYEMILQKSIDEGGRFLTGREITKLWK